MFGGGDDDIDFSISDTSRSRLSSLFQDEETHSQANQVLMFHAPKQPKPIDNANQLSETLSLLYAVAVHAYKLKDGQYAQQGKLGCAILGSHKAHLYRLLLYKGKQEQVATVNITAPFQFTVQANNYASFYDNKKENWSLKFEKEDELCQFTKQVCLAKAFSQGEEVTSLVTQDLYYGSGLALDIGCSAELKYTAWLLSNHTLGEKILSNMDSNSSYSFRLGKKKVSKGWYRGLQNAQEGSRRMLILPPGLVADSDFPEKSIPKNSTLAFEFHIVKVRSRESSDSPGPKSVDTGKKPEVAPRRSISQEDNIRLRGASISEQLSQSPKKDKAQLISRMAKMGTATLPLQGAVPAQPSSSDSEGEVAESTPSAPVENNTVQAGSPKPTPRTRSRTPSGSSIRDQRESHSISMPSSQVSESGLPQSSPYISAGMSLHSASVVSAPHSTVLPLYSTAIPAVQPPPYACVPSSYPMYHSQPGGIAPSPMLPHSGASYSGLPMHDPNLPVFMSESRANTTEIKLTLSKISNQTDAILNKVENLGQQSKPVMFPSMENNVLLQNLEKIIQENTQLKEEVESKTSKINSLNEKICDLFQKNQRFFEENLLEQKSNSSFTHSRIFTLEQEKADLSHQLSEAQSRVQSTEQKLKEVEEASANFSLQLTAERETRIKDSKEMGDLKAEVASLQEKLQQATVKLQDAEDQRKQLESALEKVQLQQEQKTSLETSEIELKEKLCDLENQVHSVTEKLTESERQSKVFQEKLAESERQSNLLKEKCQEKLRMMRESYVNLSQQLKVAHQQQAPSADIRRAMNILYKLLQGQFSPEQSYNGSQVLELALKMIRSVTIQILEKPNSQQQPPSSQVSEQASNHQEVLPGNTTEVSSTQNVNSKEEFREVKDAKKDGVIEDANNTSRSPDPTENPEAVVSDSKNEVEKKVVEEIKEEKIHPKEETTNDSSSHLNAPKSSATERNKLQPSPEIWRPRPPSDEEEEEEDVDWLS